VIDLRRPLRNFSATTVSRLASAALSFGLFAFLARRWSTVDLGAFATILAIFTLLQQAPLLGLHLVLGRDRAAKKESRKRQAVNAAAIALTTSLVLAALVVGIGFALYPATMHPALGLMALALIPTALVDVEEGLLWGEERLGTTTAVNLLENVVRVAGSAVLLYQGYGLTAVWACFLVARCVMLVAYWMRSGLRDVVSFADFDPALVRHYLRISPTFAGILVASASINRIDFMLLSKLGRLSDVGYYAAAYRLNELALMLPITRSIVLFPVFSRVLVESERQFLELLRGVVRFNFIVGVPLAFAVAVCAKPILTLFFGATYGESTVVLRLLIFVPVLAGLDQALTGVQLLRGRQRDDLRVLTISLIAYVALLVALIPPFGFVGAGIATLATGVLQLVLRYASTRGADIVPPMLGLIVRPMAAALVMLGTLIVTGDRGIATRLVVGLLGYAVALASLRAVTRAELSRLAGGFIASPQRAP
jgi:O-antigen/teichoic acid export membrane protein